MKVHQLQALVAVADAGSIRAAARLLDLSHAAVTKALRELEAEAQLPLVMRTARGVDFTETGRLLLGHARLVVGQIERANTELAELRGEVTGRLSIAVTPWIMLTFLTKAVQLFRERMPGVQLEIFEGLTAVALPRLREGSLDFAVGPVTPTMSLQEFDSTALLTYEMSVIAHRNHPCANATSLHQLLDQDWVVNYTTANYGAFMQELFWQHGAQIDRSHLHCAHSTSLLFEMVRHGGMLTHCPSVMMTTESMQDWVTALPLKERFEPSQLGIITRRNAVLGTAAQCFKECLLTEIKRRARSAAAADRALFDVLTVLF
ncbi:LysR family transcriptional regulator [Pseudomonas moorei]|uniref:LysR family transcriptional regulator n=1 Tax=Pseudomonas moorei TaxID=395599 RepID=UPI0020101ADF|nr:LysR family transcriptional regulator [Pseudomonas moorei]